MLSLFLRNKKLIQGNTITLGRYPQNNNSLFSPIKWIVLKTENEQALLISKYCIITAPYCKTSDVSINPQFLSWEFSNARYILNNDFFNTAFTKQEQDRILSKKTVYSDFLPPTYDKVFLLSEEEILSFFPNKESRYAKPTTFACKTGARIDMPPKGNTCWWLLPYVENYATSFESIHICPKVVFQTGEIQYHSRNVYHTDFTLRPCIILKI